jgi:putative transcriptional regulator
MGDEMMKDEDFAALTASLEEAIAHARGEHVSGLRALGIEVDRGFVVATRLAAGLTQAEFARVTGASLGTVRKWESGERSPSGAAATLVRVMARSPDVVLEEAGFARER